MTQPLPRVPAAEPPLAAHPPAHPELSTPV